MRADGRYFMTTSYAVVMGDFPGGVDGRERIIGGPGKREEGSTRVVTI